MNVKINGDLNISDFNKDDMLVVLKSIGSLLYERFSYKNKFIGQQYDKLMFEHMKYTISNIINDYSHISYLYNRLIAKFEVLPLQGIGIEICFYDKDDRLIESYDSPERKHNKLAILIEIN